MPHVLEIEQILRLLEAAKKESEHDWLLILVTFLHALRASEAVGIKAENIVGGRLVLKRKKRSRPVNDALVSHHDPLLDEHRALVDFVSHAEPNQKLFKISARTFQRRMHRYGQLAGLPDLFCHPHTLKHSILDYLSDKMELVKLQDRSGHVSLGSLGTYLHPKKSVTDALVRDAIDSISL